jgi:PPP family 3-phenylpropionic acid transporter
MRKFWPFTFYFLLFAGMASVSPFMVLYYQGLGFTGTQIGLLTGIAPLVTIFSAPLWTGLADASGQHRLAMSLAILCGVSTLIVFPLLNAIVPVLLIAVLFNACMAPITPFADSSTMFMLAEGKEMYGRVRLGGTIGYGLAALVTGMLVQNYGLRFAFWGCAALYFFSFIVSQRLRYGQVETGTPLGGRTRSLLANPRWLLFLVLAFAGGAALAAFNNYLFSYMKELGANESMMGLSLTIGTISEIPVLFFGNQLIKRLKPYGLLILSMAVVGLRFLLFAASREPGLILVIQLLNGLTIPAMWVAGVSYADANAPPGMSATVQGLFNAVFFGIGMAVGGFLGGPLLDRLGGQGLYFLFGAAVLAIVAVVALFQRSLPAEQQGTPNAVIK